MKPFIPRLVVLWETAAKASILAAAVNGEAVVIREVAVIGVAAAMFEFNGQNKSFQFHKFIEL